jgi:hypothetical protein
MKHTEIKNFLNFLSGNSNKMLELEKLRNKYPKGNLNKQNSKKFLSKDLIPFAKGNGFNFTIQQYKNFKKEVYDESKQKIDLDILENVSGGLDKKLTKGIASALALMAVGVPVTAGIVSHHYNHKSGNDAKKDENSENEESSENKSGSNTYLDLAEKAPIESSKNPDKPHDHRPLQPHRDQPPGSNDSPPNYRNSHRRNHSQQLPPRNSDFHVRNNLPNNNGPQPPPLASQNASPPSGTALPQAPSGIPVTPGGTPHPQGSSQPASATSLPHTSVLPHKSGIIPEKSHLENLNDLNFLNEVEGLDFGLISARAGHVYMYITSRVATLRRQHSAYGDPSILQRCEKLLEMFNTLNH